MTESIQLQSEPGLFSVLSENFLLYAEVERNFAKETIIKYRDCLKQIRLVLGDRSVCAYSKDDLMVLKQAMLRKDLSISRQVGILAAFKSFLLYCYKELGLAVISPELVIPPKRPRRDVVFMSVDEVEDFVSVIPLKTEQGTPCVRGLRFRALVEVLLGTAMRISEVLSLDRSQVDFLNGEAKIIGKGNKERVVFFTERSLFWLSQYLKLRKDDQSALFVCQDGKRRLKRTDIWRPFDRYRKRAGIARPETLSLILGADARRVDINTFYATFDPVLGRIPKQRAS